MTVTDTPSTATTEEPKKEEEKEELCGAEEHHDKFNPKEYLEAFYVSAKEDVAMQIVLFFLPGILYRLPTKISSVLDLGAGPTVYLPISLRNRADKIYTSDYAPANRETLLSWVEDRSQFNWKSVCEWIATIEASEETPTKMQEIARNKVEAIYEVNVHEDDVIRSVCWQKPGSTTPPRKFQVVTTVFCLEYSCETLEGYHRAVRGACSLIEDDGYLVQGGVLDATTYSFGNKRFKCHRLHRSHIVDALNKNGFSTTEAEGFKFITHDDIFLLVSKKVRHTDS